jgi:hypothetical protein
LLYGAFLTSFDFLAAKNAFKSTRFDVGKIWIFSAKIRVFNAYKKFRKNKNFEI